MSPVSAVQVQRFPKSRRVGGRGGSNSSTGLLRTLLLAAAASGGLAATTFPTNYALARVDFTDASKITSSGGRVSAATMGDGVYQRLSGMSSWQWTQSYSTRRPKYVTSDYVCWNAAHFQPTAENSVSQVLTLEVSRKQEYNYWYQYRLSRGLTALIVAKWDGQQGSQNFQNMMGRSIDTTTYGSFSGTYGWMATMSEKGVVGMKGQVPYRYCYWSCYYSTYRTTSRVGFSDTTAPHLFRFQVDTSGYMRIAVDSPGATGTAYRDNYELWNTYSNSYYLSYDENAYWSSYYGPLTIGGGAYYSESSSQGAYGFNGKIYEAVVFHNYARSVSTSVITQAENYLMEKYFLKCSPVGDVMSSAMSTRFATLPTACQAGKGDVNAGTSCAMSCFTGYKYAGDTAYLPRATDTVASVSCVRGTWVQGNDYQLPDCHKACAELPAPSNAGKCSYKRFTDDFSSTTYLLQPDPISSWFYPRYTLFPPLPDSELYKLWDVESGQLIGDTTVAVCGTSKVQRSAFVISKYNHVSEAATRDHTFKVDVEVDRVLTGGHAGVILRAADDNNYIAMRVIPGTSTQLLMFVKDGVEDTTRRAVFTCSLQLDVSTTVKFEWKSNHLYAYCGTATTATGTVLNAGSFLPTGTVGVYVDAARAKFDNFELSTTCAKSGTTCDGTDPGAVCSFGCLDGWETASGNAERTCGWDGVWSGSDLVCKRSPPDWSGATRTVPERSPVNTLVGDPLEASVAGGDQAVVWAITAGDDDGIFKIGSCDGQIRIARAVLDFNAEPTYSLTVAARTDGDATAQTEATVVINVVDVNDPPTITDPKSVDVDENSAVGTAIGTLGFSDPDGDSVTWKIGYGNDLGLFAIDANSGELSVAKTGLNYEVKDLYSIFVTITDEPGGGKTPESASAFIDVAINDVNDAPTFTNNTVLWINEANATKGTDIGILPVSDEDGDPLDDIRIDEVLLWMGPGGNYGTGKAAPDPEDVIGANYGEDNAYLDAGIAMLQFDEDLVYDQTPNEGDDEYPFTFRNVLVRAVYAVQATVFDTSGARSQAWAFVGIEADIEARADPIVTDIWVCGGSSSNPLTSCLSQNFSSSGELISTSPISKTAMSTSGGDWIAIRGKNFVDSFEVSATYASIGGDLEYTATDCQIVDEDSESEDSTLAACKSVKGVGADLIWTTSINREVRLGPILRTSYEAPRITGISGEGSTDISELATIGGESVRLTGTNIGYSGMDATTIAQLVRVTYGENDEFEADVESVSESSLVVRTVEGMGKDLSWTVVIAGQAATVDDEAVLVTYAPPVISAVRVPFGSAYTLSTLDTAGGQTVTISGSNFGPYDKPGSDPSTPLQMVVSYGTKPAGVTSGDTPPDHEYITGVTCTKDRSTPHTRLTCTTKPGIGRTHAWIVSVGGQTSAPSVDTVSYLPPVITSVQGPGTVSADTAGGQTVFIRGQHFGPKELNGVEWVKYGASSIFQGVEPVGDEDDLFEAVSCSVTNDPSDSSSMITCVTNEGRGTGHSWNVRIGGQDAVSVFAANTGYGQPIIATFSGIGSKDALTPGGQEVVITGRNFGPQFDSLVSVSYAAEVTVRDPETGARIGKEIHTFYPDLDQCTMPAEYKHTRIVCETAEGAGTALSWNITVSDQVSRNPTTDYHVPEISGIAIYSGTTFSLTSDVPSWSSLSALTPKTTGANSDGGDIVVISGTNFGPPTADISKGLLQWVRYGRGAHIYELPLDPKFVRHDSHTRIIARLLPGVGRGLAFSLSVADQESNPSEQTFDFAAPEVFAILRCVGSTYQPEGNAQRVTIMGRNFGLLDRSGEVFVTFGSEHDGTLIEELPITSRSPRVPTDDSIWPAGFDRSAAQSITFDLPMSLGADRAVSVRTQPIGRPSMAVSSVPATDDTTGTAGYSNSLLHTAACASTNAVSTWKKPSDAADYSSVFTYLDPVVTILALDPVRSDNAEEKNKAATYFLADQAKARILRISGTNFGPPQGTDAVERIVQVRDASKFELGFTTTGVVVDSWSDSELVAYTIVGEGELRVLVRSKSWDGRTVEQYSNSTMFEDLSPSISGAEGVAGGYPTHGWTEEHNNAYIRLPVQYLGKAKKVTVTMGDVECPVVAWKADDEDYERDPIVMDGALDGNGHTPFQVNVLRPQAQAELAARGESGATDADAFYTLQDLDESYEWDIWVRLPEGPTGSNQNSGAAMQITITKDDDTTDATPVTIGYDAPEIQKIKVWEDKDVNPTLVAPDREYCWRKAGGSKGASLTWCSNGKEVDRVMVPTRGAIVRVEGENFGVCPVLRASNGRTFPIGPTATCGEEFYVGPPGGLPSRSHEHVTFEIPPGEGDGTDPFFGFGEVGFVIDIDVGGQTNDLPKAASLPPIGFSYDPATITSVEAMDTGDAEISTMGGKLVLRGMNFGAAASPDYTSPPAAGMPGPSFSVYVGRTTAFNGDDELSDASAPGMINCTNVMRVSHEEITCDLQEGTGSHLDVVVTIAGVESNRAVDVFSYSRPTISSLVVDPAADDLAYETHALLDKSVVGARRLAPGDVQVARGATEGGYQVSISGSNFGVDGMEGSSCVFVAWPNRPATGSGVALQRNLRRQLVCDGKESVHGEGEVFSGHIVEWTHTRIVFLMPPGVGMRDVTVRIRGQGPQPRTGYTRFEGSQADLEGSAFWYADPVVTYFGGLPDFRGNLPKTYDIPTIGGAMVMVQGRNFGWETLRSESDLADLETAFADGGIPLPLHDFDGVSGTMDRGSASVPQGHLPYGATMVNFYRSCMSSTFELDGGYPLDDRSEYIELEDRQACSDTWGTFDEDAVVEHTDSRIVFLAPEGLGVNREVYVSHIEQDRITSSKAFVNLQSNVVLANYSKPIITGAVPQRIDIREKSERHSLTIKGENFGPTGSTEGWSAEEREAYIYINDRECSHPEVNDGAKRSVIEVPTVTGTLIPKAVLECMMEYDVVGNKNLSVKVAGQSGRLVMTDPPTLHVVCDVGYYGKDGELCIPCPDGAECDGYDADPSLEDPHTYPRPLPEWYNLNSSDAFTKKMLSACPEGHQAQSPKSDLAPASMRDSCVVPCQPSYACVGNNYCARGYKSEAPMYRCSSCDDGFYRRAGECVKCPDNPWLLIAVFVIMGMTAAGVGYYLNRSKVNIALIAIGVDYFQVLAIFAMSRVSWPPMIKELFHILSAFNLNIEITAPECSIPDIDYKTKWTVIMLLPIMAATLVLITYVVLRLSRLGRALRKWQHEEQWGVMVAGLIVIMYFLYLYVTRNVLDIFNCVPTDPPDGNLYLQPVFEECGKPGGIQMTLMPFAILALIVYVIGFPTFVGYMIYTYADTIRRDQLIRAMGFLRDFTYSESYPQTIKDCYQFRAKFSRLYYYFKPDYYFWIMTIIGRKFFIAFCSLMFNTNPAFQLAAINLVIFISYTLQVRYMPYMAPQSYELVLREWRLKVQKKSEDLAAAQRAREDAASGKEMTLDEEQETGAAEGKHYQLWEEVKYMLRYKERKSRGFNNSISNASLFKADRTQLLGLLASSAFDYNTVETVLLFCAIVVTLGGIMFESGQFDSATYQETRDAVTIILMILIIISIIYFFTVLFTELHTMMTQDQRRKRLEQQKSLRSKEGGAAAPKVLDLDVGDVTMEHNRFVQTTAEKKTDEVAGMELDAILAMEEMNSYEWAAIKGKLRDMTVRFKELQEASRAAKVASISGFDSPVGGSSGTGEGSVGSSSASTPHVTNPLLSASRRSGRAFAPTRVGAVPGAAGRRSSRRGLIRKKSEDSAD